MVTALSGLEELSEENVAGAMTLVEETGISRVLVTDASGRVLYDTRETDGAIGRYAFYTELVQALRGEDVFYTEFSDRRSKAARPRRSSTTARPSARCMPMSTIRSRRNCWVDCSKTCATYPW